jgi:microcystin-dependent protein
MAAPTPYEVEYSFAGFQASSPTTPLPASAVDNEFANIETSVESLRVGLNEIRKSDGTLANGVVTTASLSSGLLTGIDTPSAWATATAYAVDDTVFFGPKFYICLIAHTSGTFATDLAALKWDELADFTPEDIVAASAVTYDNTTSELTAEDVQDAIDEVVERLEDLEEEGAVALDGLAAEVTIKLMPYGVVLPYAGATAPSGWLLCYGQAISRTTYSNLYDSLGTVHGVGDGSTTFNVPDMRGRAVAGQDDMGGTSANRLTATSGGVNGDTLGATGGAETHVLTTAQLAAHTHAISITSAAGGAHGHAWRSASGGAAATGGLQIGDSGEQNETAFTTTTPSATRGEQIAGAAAHTHAVSGTSASAGSSNQHNNVQPTIILNYIIFAGV